MTIWKSGFDVASLTPLWVDSPWPPFGSCSTLATACFPRQMWRFKWLQAVKTQGGIAIPFLECGSDIVMMMIHCDVQPTESILSVSETSSNMYQCTTMMYYTQAGSVTVCCSIGLAVLPSILPSSPSCHCQSQRPCITKSINSSNSTLPFPLTSA